MNQSKLLDLLESDARLTSQDLADILNEDKDEVAKEFVVTIPLLIITRHYETKKYLPI